MPELEEVGSQGSEPAALPGAVARAGVLDSSTAVLFSLQRAPVRVAEVTAAGPERPRLALHEWIPMGHPTARTQCRCCHCGLVRTYEFASAPTVSYSRYGEVIVSGALQTADVPTCSPRQNPMPPSVGARSWDIVSLL